MDLRHVAPLLTNLLVCLLVKPGESVDQFYSKCTTDWTLGSHVGDDNKGGIYNFQLPKLVDNDDEKKS